MLKSQKTVSVLVRYGNRGRVRAFREKSRKTDKKVRYAVRSASTVSRGKRYGKADKFGPPSVIYLQYFKIIFYFPQNLIFILNSNDYSQKVFLIF